jgi:hypothetical protein
MIFYVRSQGEKSKLYLYRDSAQKGT